MVIDLKTNVKLINRSDILSSYLDDIRHYKILTVSEEKELFQKIKNGDTKSRERIIESNQRFIFAVAKRYASDDQVLMDLINEGNIGLIKAIDSYDLNKETRFLTHAVWYIKREMNSFIANDGKIIKQSNFAKLNNKVKKIKTDYLNVHGLPPSADEIIKILNEKYKCNVVDERDLYDLTINSINENCSEDEDYTFDKTDNYIAKSSSFNDYETNEKNDYYQLLSEQFLNNINYNNKIIIKMLYGIGYDRCYEIAEVAKKFNITNERVRQLKTESLNKMKEIYHLYQKTH